MSRNRTNQIQNLDWTDSLKFIKSNFFAEEQSALNDNINNSPTDKSGAINKGARTRTKTIDRKKEFKPTLTELSEQIKIDIQTITEFLKNRIPDYNPNLRRRLNSTAYILAIRRFDNAYYRLHKVQFDKILLSNNINIKSKIVKAKPTYAQPKKVVEERYSPSDFYPGSDKLTDFSRAKVFEISWGEIIFNDFSIQIKYGNNYSFPYPLKEARKSYRLLKKYIQSLHLDNIQVTIGGNKVLGIQNIEQLNQVVAILKIREEFIQKHEQGKVVILDKLKTDIEILGQEFIVKIAKNFIEAECIDYLAFHQEEDFRIVPAFEVIPINGSYVTEDTFIFTRRKGDNFLLIWESTHRGRATYVFTTNKKRYIDAIQSIYDYISSPIKGKRTQLRSNSLSISGLVQVGHIKHNDIAQWIAKLEHLIKNFTLPPSITTYKI